MGGFRSGAALGVLAATLLGPSFARAQVAPVAERRFSLDYRAPAECPDGLSLVAAIQARTERAALVARDAAAVHLAVELLDSGRTTLQVDMPEGSFQREYQASCTDAVASIAVIASMVLEAGPAERETLIDRESAPRQPPAAAAAFPEEVAPSPPPPPRTEPKAAAVKPLRRRPDVVRPRAREQTALAWAVAAGGAVETAVAPTPPLGVTAGVEGWLDRKRFWAPGLQASILATATATHTTPDGEGKFRLLAGHLKACVWRLPIGASFRVLPCAVLEAGSLAAAGAGEAIINEKTTSMLWLAGGASLRAQLDVVRWLALESSAGLKALAWPDKFIFRPTSLVYEVPRVSLGFGLGLSARLP